MLLSVQNSNRMASRFTTIASFPSAFFNSCNIQGNIQAFRLTGLIWWQKLTWLFQHFPVSQWRDLPKPITILCQRIATNGIASFCIDHKWHQMAFFVFVKTGKSPLPRALRETKQLSGEQSLFPYNIKQIDSMLPWICPVIDHRWRQNVIRTSVTHSAITSCATVLFLPHFDIICDLLLDRCTATWNLFVK